MSALLPGDPVVRAGEEDVAGRRIAARGTPYDGEAGRLPFRFDPVARTIRRRVEDARVVAGPADSDPWRRLFLRVPAGPVLVGPACPAERSRGAARAAAVGAREAGRAVYLLDPEPSLLPPRAAEDMVALLSGVPDAALLGALEQIAQCMPAGLLLPVLPGWTAEPEFLEAALAECARAGGRFLAGFAIASSGDSRRMAVAARGALEPGSEEDYFDRAHHGDWDGESAAGVAWLERRAPSHGLAARPPRPRGLFEPAANAAAAARLEDLADSERHDEHRAALLRGAVRWLDERTRDLRPIVAEGNFRKIFPFGGEIAPEVERALLGAGSADGSGAAVASAERTAESR